jgi:5-methylthioadenosine/S-adenosylhomocysteine deaminase
MKLKLYNAKIMTSPFDEIFDGEIFINNDKIFKVCRKDERTDFLPDKSIDCKGNLLINGFCNTHTHSAMSLFRGVADDLSLDSWLFDKIFPLEAKLTENDIYYGCMLQMAEYAKSGITAIADMYSHPEITAKIAQNSNIAVVMCGGLNDLSLKTDDVLKDIESNYLKFNKGNDRLKFQIGLHAEYTCSDKLIEGVADLSQSFNASTYIHLSETLKEVGECTVKRNGLTPPQYLHKIGFFDNGGIAAHCTYIDKDDMLLLKECNIYPAINSASNLKLASGIAPVYSMINSGLNLTIGTDSVASNNSTSMFKEMYLFSCLQKANMKMADIINAEETLFAATINGYNALNIKGGELKKGNYADIVLIDINQPNMQPENNLKKHLVYSADNSNVLMTIAAGKIIYEKGNYNIGEDINKIYNECEKSIKRLCKSI